MDTQVSSTRAPRSVTSKKGRIIIRNLSFKATEEAVKNWFLKYGEIDDVKLLKKHDGTMVGCGFVQFRTVACAAKAIKECNAKPFLGRQIAIDWAIPKQQYTSNNKSADDNAKEAVDENSVSEVKSANTEESGKEDDEEGGSEDEDDDEGGSEDEDDEESESGMESEEDVGTGSLNDVKESNWKGQNSRPSDVEEKKTIFIRNLDFSTSQDALKNYMEQFGKVQYALLCMDKVMERPKGTGFVKFMDNEGAQKCLEEYTCSSLHLDGRTLNAVLAVTREDLEKQKSEQKKENKDKRNLYLAREGFIRPGTRAAHGVSSTDMAKRQQNEMWKKQMLRNLHMFISPERLCVHNIPLKMTDKQLQKLFLKHSSKDAKIVEARIMRDLKALTEGNIHPSKGYGFVTFSKHEDALLALRNINNNPDLFTNDKRPIVEFSVENRAAVKAKMQRAQKSRENVNKGKIDKPKKQIAAVPQEGETVPEFSGAKADPKIKTLPSHSGPKIRHRKRVNSSAEDGSNPAKKPKITRKMFKNPDKRKVSMKKKSVQETTTSNKGASTKNNKYSAKNSAPIGLKSNSSSQQKKKWFD